MYINILFTSSSVPGVKFCVSENTYFKESLSSDIIAHQQLDCKRLSLNIYISFILAYDQLNMFSSINKHVYYIHRYEGVSKSFEPQAFSPFR